MLKTILTVFIAFAISAALGPVVIPLLRRLKIGQTIRSEGPESHLAKNGTPTMGGVLILLGFIVGSVIFIKDSEKILPILILTVGFGLVGFADDFIKVVLKRSKGLRAWQKLGLQFLITGAFAAYIYFHEDMSFNMIIPFTKGTEIVMDTMPYLAITILFFVVL